MCSPETGGVDIHGFKTQHITSMGCLPIEEFCCPLGLGFRPFACLTVWRIVLEPKRRRRRYSLGIVYNIIYITLLGLRVCTLRPDLSPSSREVLKHVEAMKQKPKWQPFVCETSLASTCPLHDGICVCESCWTVSFPRIPMRDEMPLMIVVTLG